MLQNSKTIKWYTVKTLGVKTVGKNINNLNSSYSGKKICETRQCLGNFYIFNLK